MKLEGLVRRIATILILNMSFLIAFAQSHSVTGVVKDASGEPMIGVNVLEKGTSNGTITDLDGRYTISGLTAKSVLVVSYIGYQSREVTVGNQTTIHIVLSDDSQALDEIVVVGYGVVKKRDLTGSVTSVKAGEIEKVASSNAMQAMQAKVPGLDIQQSDGQAGAGMSMTLRGNRSISASNNPLILVDGVEYGSTLDINPNDIESMEVLKDASSTAIYGTRGANGVVIITTKRGKAGKTRVNLNAYLSSNSPTHVPQVMYGRKEVQRLIDKANYQADKASGNWGSSNLSVEDVLTERLEDFTEMDIYRDGSYTDWADIILQNGLTQSYEASVSGGNDKTNFNISMGVMYEEGLLRNDALDRYNGKVNVDHKISDRFKVGTSLLYTYKSHDARSAGVFSQSMKMTTITHAYRADGSIIETPNPRYPSHCSPLLDEVPGAYQNNIETTRFFGNVYLDINPMKGMFFKTMFALDRLNQRTGLYQDYQSQERYQSPSTGYISSEFENKTGYTWENTLNYNTNFGGSKHDLTTLLGHSMTQTVQEISSTYGDCGKEHYYESAFYDLSKIASPKTANDYIKTSMLSFFGRLNYKFNEKYLLTASLRADGASQLAEGNKWGYFPSVAAAWRVIDEEFMTGTRGWLSNLKLRASWGLSGNAAVNAYSTITALGSDNIYYYLGGSDIAGKVPAIMGNTDLTWEKTSAFNVGLDFGILDGRISGSIDVYKSKTYDLLYYKSIPASSVYPNVLANIGETEGHGLEIALNTLIIKEKHFSWDVNWSYSTAKDKITKLSEGVERNISGTTGQIVGKPVSIYYDFETNGCWNAGEYAEYKTAWEARHPGETIGFPSAYGEPGTLKIIDRDDNGILNDDDKRVYDRSPKHLFGMSNTFAYKNISLSVLVYARLGGYLSYGMNNQLNYETANWGDLDYWTPAHTNARFPSPGAASTIFASYGSTLMYEKADYIKIKDITLSYTLPKAILTPIGIEHVNVYGSLKNFFTFSRIDNYDPERGGSINFPLAKQVVVGLTVQF